MPLLDRVGGLGVGRDAQRHARERIGARPRDQAAEVGRAAADQLGQAAEDDLRPPGQVGRQDRDRERRAVAEHREPVAIVDQAALGRDRHDSQAVVVGLVAVLCAAHDLELEQPRAQRQAAERAAEAELDQSAAREALVRGRAADVERAEQVHRHAL